MNGWRSDKITGAALAACRRIAKQVLRTRSKLQKALHPVHEPRIIMDRSLIHQEDNKNFSSYLLQRTYDFTPSRYSSPCPPPPPKKTVKDTFKCKKQDMPDHASYLKRNLKVCFPFPIEFGSCHQAGKNWTVRSGAAGVD